MKRALILALAASVFAAGAAIAGPPRFRLVVPVEIENVPAAVSRGRLLCNVASSAAYDPMNNIGEGMVDFAIEGGRYSGRLGMDIFPGGPLGVDGTTEGRSYSCTLMLNYRCIHPDGHEGWCTTGANAHVRDGAHPAVHAMFATDPARPPSARIQGTIDRSSATTLAVRFH
jgi:hypothetical protein